MAKAKTAETQARHTTNSARHAGTRVRSERTKKGEATRRRKRQKHRELLRSAQAKAQLEAVVTRPGMSTDEALQMTLDRAVAVMQYAGVQVDNLEEEEFFRDSMMGKIPNEWIRFEHDMRMEVCNLAARMMGLDIDSRRANAAEVMANAIAPVLKGVFEELKLTPAQRRKAPALVRAHLEAIEGAGHEMD